MRKNRRLSTVLAPALALLCAGALAFPGTFAFGEDASAASTGASASSTQSGTSSATVPPVSVTASSVDTSGVGDVTVSEDATTALASDATFGISKYSRLNKGTNKEYSSVYYGYRYSMAAKSAFSAVAIDQSTVLVYVSPDMLSSLGLSLSDVEFQQVFFKTLHAVDDAASNGGTKLSSLTDATYLFTSEDTFVRGEYTYRFGVEVEEGYYYTTVTKAGSDDGSGGALFNVSGTLTAADATSLATAPTGLAALQRFFQTLDWSPLWVSLRTTGVAIVVIFILGLLAAWLTIGVSDRLKGILDTVFTIPMVLPPTVCGFLLLILFGQSSSFGRWLISMGINIVFTWQAAVIACIVVGFPLMYRTARGAFESLDPSMLDAARTLGWREWRIFLTLMLPLAWPTIASGTVLAFARAMGEFGCTLFFAGNYAGVTQTIPIAIYFDWMAGSTDVAIFWVIVVILISFLVILFINIYSSHSQRFRAGYEEKKQRKRKKGHEAPMEPYRGEAASL